MIEETTRGQAACELYEMATGAPLDERDTASVEFMLKVAEDGRWISHTLMLGGARPVVLDVRVLAGLFLFGERVVWSALDGRAVVDAFQRLRALVESAETLRSRIRRISAANGAQRIEVEGGGSLRFVPRSSRGAGRGLVADCCVVTGPTGGVGSLKPMLAGAPNPQLVLDAP